MNTRITTTIVPAAAATVLGLAAALPFGPRPANAQFEIQMPADDFGAVANFEIQMPADDAGKVANFEIQVPGEVGDPYANFEVQTPGPDDVRR